MTLHDFDLFRLIICTRFSITLSIRGPDHSSDIASAREYVRRVNTIIEWNTLRHRPTCPCRICNLIDPPYRYQYTKFSIASGIRKHSRRPIDLSRFEEIFLRAKPVSPFSPSRRRRSLEEAEFSVAIFSLRISCWSVGTSVRPFNSGFLAPPMFVAETKSDSIRDVRRSGLVLFFLFPCF